MFQITDQPIVPPTPDCPTAGGFVTFEGRVRTMNEGRPVQFLEYEAYGELASSEGNNLLEEAKTRYGLEWVYASHRVGMLEIGDMAVWIGCGAVHRKEAFEACEFLIEEMKKRLPIWKKEHYADGPSKWVNLKQETPVDKLQKSDFFARQLVMPEVGPTGQVALGKARVLIVGAGGLANGALPYLAAAGVGTIGIVEPDLLEASNLHRQVLYGHQDLGRSKVRLAAESLRRMHPFVDVEVYEERLTPDNASRIIERFDIVVDCTDRFDVKFLMNDVCQTLGRPLVQASIYRFDGYLQTILPGGPCLRCQWSDEPIDGCVETCAEAGVLGVVPGFFGILQATEVLKLILGVGECLSETQLLVDLRDLSVQKMLRKLRAGCICCASGVSELQKPTADIEVTVDDVLAWTKPFICLDLREADEPRPVLDLGQVEWRSTPLSGFQPSRDIDPAMRTVLVCASGGRSGRLAYQLREMNLQTYSLRGGVRAKFT